jgi:hypothetical protein
LRPLRGIGLSNSFNSIMIKLPELLQRKKATTNVAASVRQMITNLFLNDFISIEFIVFGLNF